MALSDHSTPTPGTPVTAAFLADVQTHVDQHYHKSKTRHISPIPNADAVQWAWNNVNGWAEATAGTNQFSVPVPIDEGDRITAVACHGYGIADITVTLYHIHAGTRTQRATFTFAPGAEEWGSGSVTLGTPETVGSTGSYFLDVRGGSLSRVDDLSITYDRPST